VANNKKIKEELNWTAQYSDLKTIMSSAWQWEQKLLQSN
jgi:UDP-glucose 4-epimerase